VVVYKNGCSWVFSSKEKKNIIESYSGDDAKWMIVLLLNGDKV
jgi:hypothetical protein